MRNIDEVVLEWNFNKATAHICSKHFEEEYLKGMYSQYKYFVTMKLH